MILQIETSTQVCSVAISAGGETILLKQLNEPNVHASMLTVLIGELMADCGYSYKQLDAVAVSMGPGSYTGLRIGVSTAKGLCYASDLPLLAVPTLKAMACGFQKEQAGMIQSDTWLLPMIDARRMEVYMTVMNGQLEIIQDTSATIVDEGTFASLASEHKLALFGNGADKFDHLFAVAQNIRVIPGFQNSAAHMSTLAVDKFTTKEFEDLAYFEPYYLKDFVPTKPKT